MAAIVRITAILIIFITLAFPGNAGVMAAKETETPTPTWDPGQPTYTPTPPPVLATPTPEATITPWIVVVVTATPQRTPPSWAIQDLDKKIKDKKGGFGKSSGLGMTLQADPSPIPPEVDDTISQFMIWLVDKQLEYRSLPAHEYAQMLPSHSTPPADGIHEYPDGWYNHPTDQDFSWADLNAFQFEPLPFAIAIDQYNGPSGEGFVACFTLRVDGADWRRCVNHGPESLRNTEWGQQQP